MSKLILMMDGQEMGKEMLCPLHFEKVDKKKNSRIMHGCEQIISGELVDDREFKVFQSANRNVITIECDGFYNHVILSDLVEKVLLESEVVKP